MCPCNPVPDSTVPLGVSAWFDSTSCSNFVFVSIALFFRKLNAEDANSLALLANFSASDSALGTPGGVVCSCE